MGFVARRKYGNRITEVDGANRTSWSAAEDETIVRMRLARETISRVATALGRSESSVENRWLRLRKQRGLRRVRGNKIADPVQHFWARVDRSGGPNSCWPWGGQARQGAGYGAVVFDMGEGRKNYGAHRVAFYLSNGRRQACGLQVLHSCDNPPCCNPAHLSEGTRSENMRQAYERGRHSGAPRAGEDHHRALLTVAQVEAIRRLRNAGAKRRDIAQLAGVAVATIDNIVARRTWGSL